MNKTVFLFPGQGSQEVGMGRDLFGQDEYFQSLVEQASQCTGEDLGRICLKGPEKKLARAFYLQPLLVAVSLGYLRHVTEKKIKADYVLGHSLGEITALAAAGVIDSGTAVRIAAERGRLMDEAAAACQGGMMAVLSVGPDRVQALIDECRLRNDVFIANLNSPDQTVVSGTRSCLDRLAAVVGKAGGTCKKLNVAGPWHSPYLKKAYEQFQAWVRPIDFKPPRISLILNRNGQPESDPQTIKDLITESLIHPVHFTQCMQYCRMQGVDAFLEIGPGRILSGLVRANGFMQATRIYKVNNLRGVELAVADWPS